MTHYWKCVRRPQCGNRLSKRNGNAVAAWKTGRKRGGGRDWVWSWVLRRKLLIDTINVANSIDRHTLQCVCEKKIQKIITRLPILTFLVNSSLWEVNFSNWFYCNSDCRFRYLSKKYLHKLFFFFQNSNGNIVKNEKNYLKTG